MKKQKSNPWFLRVTGAKEHFRLWKLWMPKHGSLADGRRIEGPIRIWKSEWA